MEEKFNSKISNKITKSDLDGTATHSGWMQFYASFTKSRDDCIILGKKVLGNDLSIAIRYLSDYHSSIYSMAQQIFSFYDEEIEDKLTTEWLEIGNEVNDFLNKINDKDFRGQIVLEGQTSLDMDLKKKLLKYFNKIDRMAANAGLYVNKEEKDSSEPKKGLVGFQK